MPIITFWSNNEKAIGQTVSASIAAVTMAINYNYKILLISADVNNDMLELCFGPQESNKKILDNLGHKEKVNLGSGIEGIIKLANSNRVTPELIHDYTKIVFNRLEVLYSPTVRERQEGEEESEKNSEKYIMAKIKYIIMNASQYYDQIIIDLKKGMKYQEQQEIFNLSDVIVANVDQRIENITDAMKDKEIERNKDKIIWNICRHDKNSKYNTKNLLRTIFKKDVLYETPYNTLISEATQEGKIAEIMLRFRTIKEQGDNLDFVSKTKQLVEGILMKYQQLRTMI